MNGKKSKRLRRQSETLLIEWLRTMIPEGEDTSKINKKNLHEFLPEQTHIFANNKFMLSAYSLRWFYKLIKRNPNLKIKDLNA
jgi:hypothetical protein|tara:strand:+ start:1005 stop:1253 length:249 start_codon:yes stop_codon:yes gene_type:complete